MKKLLLSLLSASIIFSASTTVFAESADKIVNPQNIKQIQESESDYETQKGKVSEVITKVNESVVAIIGENTKYKKDTEYEYSKYPQNLQHGSGVIIEDGGKILTNNHVIDGVKDIYVVTYDGNVYKAQLVYTDKEIDLALLKINRTDLKPIKLAKETEVSVGDEVVAIGTPLFFGYRNSASKGIISGLNRPVDDVYTYLQTDASINPGNSGGPLVNMQGELVGINTMGYTLYDGVNFSIPVGNINYFLDHYKRFGKIKRCFTGIELEENWAAMLGIPTNQGLKVVTIKKNAIVTPNDVKEGDTLESIDNKAVTSIAQYNEILKDHLPGDKVNITFMRNNKKFTISVTLKEQPDENSSK